jgi:probable phosphoglycerate mutase
MVAYALLLRHAQSVWNAEGRWQGQADPPLSELGFAQANSVARHLSGWPGFDLVASSDLRRARETARILAEGSGYRGHLFVESSLREYDVGEWSGLSRSEIGERWPAEFDLYLSGNLLSPPGGEDRLAFDRRVLAAAERLSSLAVAEKAERVLVVAHGGVIRSLARSHGASDYRATPLAGYHAEVVERTIVPTVPVDLLDPDGANPPAWGVDTEDGDPVAL